MNNLACCFENQAGYGHHPLCRLWTPEDLDRSFVQDVLTPCNVKGHPTTCNEAYCPKELLGEEDS